MLQSWALYRHPNKPKHWMVRKYWCVDEGQGWVFQPTNSDKRLARHNHAPIQRHVKVQGQRSPYDGDWLYWSRRLGRHPDIPARVAILLKRQQGKCDECGLYFLDGDPLEVDHIVPNWIRGNDALVNLQLLHRHCHDRKTARETGSRGADDKRRIVEEPDEGKPSRLVLKPSQEGRPS
jgi:RNA-directed DNA polymerase